MHGCIFFSESTKLHTPLLKATGFRELRTTNLNFGTYRISPATKRSLFFFCARRPLLLKLLAPAVATEGLKAEGWTPRKEKH